MGYTATMPWKETFPVKERLMFVAEVLKAERSMADVCRDFEVSRKTGYKWLDRYQRDGVDGLKNQSRAPLSHPNAVALHVVEQLLQIRREHTTWGPRKIVAYLEGKKPKLPLPAPSTVGALLTRYGLAKARRRPKRKVPRHRKPFRESTAPNMTWCADYKGEFLLGNQRYCYPLTITDAYSRWIIRCHGRYGTKHQGAVPVFKSAFQEYGLPETILSDNGSPFATKAPRGLSRLSIWWLKLGIAHVRIMPGKPQQNGRHERMHRTLKKETTKPPAQNMRRQQEVFDRFQSEFNHERPHEALGQKTPARFYEPSPRPYPDRVPGFEYPENYRLRKVTTAGRFRWPGRHVIQVGAALTGEYVGCVQATEELWKVYLGPLQLGLIDTTKIELGLIRTE